MAAFAQTALEWSGKLSHELGFRNCARSDKGHAVRRDRRWFGRFFRINCCFDHRVAARDFLSTSGRGRQSISRGSHNNCSGSRGRAVGTMRLQWVQDLRKILSEYHSVLVSYKAEDYRKASELGTQLDLMLNLDEPEHRALWEVADRLFKTSDIEKRVAMDPELMSAGRVVLKKEWRKIKAETRGS
jgi:hypothetical protein